MKKLFLFCLLVISLIASTGLGYAADRPASTYSAAAVAQTQLAFKIDERQYFVVNSQGSTQKTLDATPFVAAGRTLIPIRYVIEPLGGKVTWNQKLKEVDITLKGTTIKLWVGKAQAEVNGKSTPIDSSNSKIMPIIYKSRAFVPLRFVLETVKAEVLWDPTEKSVLVRYPVPSLLTFDAPGFSIKYPDNWTKASDRTALFTSPEDDNQVVVRSQEVSSTVTFADFVTANVDDLQQTAGFKVLESMDATVGGIAAHKVTFTSLDNGVTSEFTQYWVMKNSTVYIVQYSASDALFANYMSMFSQTVGSFTLK
ncbi:MAG TPA: stalk domain-containing protein [Candidatus Aquicultor sp.]|jgi:hypothetical protein